MDFPDMFSLAGKRAIVCGSSQGIGRAIAVALARQGAAISLVARDAAALEKVRAELPAAGAAHEVVVADFADPIKLRETIDAHLGKVGTAHILINNTGGPPHGPIVEAKPEDFLRAITMHVVCNQHLVQATTPGMKQARYGRVINIISTSVKEPIPGLGVSNTTRGAVASWAKTLSRELAPFGITVNNILPGYTDTARLGSLIDSKAKAGGASKDTVKSDMIAKIPMGRLAKPDEIAAGAAFLASPAASYVTGINLPIDGGRLASH